MRHELTEERCRDCREGYRHRRCAVCQRMVLVYPDDGVAEDCPGPQPSAVATEAQEPDPDEVRGHVALYENGSRHAAVMRGLITAARAWLREREQPAPALSIEQVIEACGVSGYWRVSVNPCDRGFGAHIVMANDDYLYSATASTPEAAIQALGEQAVAKLREQREQADAALKKLERA